MIIKLLSKSKELRAVNILGLSVIFASLLLSLNFIKRELSYDRFNQNADRIVRFSVQFDGLQADGRVADGVIKNAMFNEIADIEKVITLQKINTGTLNSQGENHIINDYYFASPDFFDVFSYPLLQGNSKTVLDAPNKAVISASYARQLFGDENVTGKEIHLSGRKVPDMTIFISGVFDDFPETSHFHTDLIISKTEAVSDWNYVYLLLHENTDLKKLKSSLTACLDEIFKDSQQKASPVVMPLTDIHLHSHLLREMEPNGNIYFIYLVEGVNALLLIIVFFNLWLNSGLIFASNRRYYQLLRLHGASADTVLRDESVLAVITGIVALITGVITILLIRYYINFSFVLTVREIVGISLLFLLATVVVALLPVVTKMSFTQFLNTSGEKPTVNFALKDVKWLLIAQYCLVMVIVSIGFGIEKQMSMVKNEQAGGQDNSIIVMKEQVYEAQEKFETLKNELIKYPEIESVTSAMQLPGAAIRDGIFVAREGESKDEARHLPLLVGGNDFIQFFKLKMLAGRDFTPNERSYDEEMAMMFRNIDENQPASGISEEYIINSMAAKELGFKLPEDALGKRLFLHNNPAISYIREGVVCGIVDNFTYANTFEASQPLIILQRKTFPNCFLIRFNPDDSEKAIQTFNEVWKKVIPKYPADYTFLQSVYDEVYRNEKNAESLVRIFALLSLLVANLGLIIVMSFVIKRKTKEIAIRKINGATAANVILMLNRQFFGWIGLAFLVSVPLAWFILSRWLDNFARKTDLNIWIFIIAGLFVCLISAIAVSLPSYRAARLNPTQALNTN